MMRKLSDYGLKESYKFRETHVPINSRLVDFNERITDIHGKVISYISPAITELETLQLINGFHFILHTSIDLRLSTEDWDKNEEKIKKVLRNHNISDNLENWGPMPPDKYGGEVGVILCYNNLEFNSRLILALLDAQRYTGDQAARQRQKELIFQWIHYLYIQYGVTNEMEMEFEFRNALNWSERLPGQIGILDNMIGVITRLKNQLVEKESK